MIKSLRLLPILFCALFGIAMFELQPSDAAKHAYKDYLPISTCQDCHGMIVDQYSESQHAKAFSDPLFQAQYFRDVLPRARKQPGFATEAKHCIACHSPIDSVRSKTLLTSKDQSDPSLSGVACDFCHTIKAYDGKAPGNGNFISDPNIERKLGPFKGADNWHHVYSELQTKSEFCGICHNAVNHHGLEVKSTYTEWKNSVSASKGIQCQDCHMNLKGFLQEGKPVYESGYAANPSSTFGVGERYRTALYTHRFPGAHSRTQIAGAETITLKIETEKPSVSSGDDIIINVFVDNSRTGHKMPSGSKELREMWLELTAYAGNRKIPIPATAKAAEAYDVAGRGPFDKEILGNDIPKGSRIYRAVFVDGSGKQTLSFYDAEKIIFDNRLDAMETRTERYYFRVPSGFKGNIFFQANLNYLQYPSSLAARFGLPAPKPFSVSTTRKEILVH